MRLLVTIKNTNKKISIKYSGCVCVCVCVCVLALVILQGNLYHFLRRLMSFVDCLYPPYFSTLSHKRHGFRGKKLLDMKLVFYFSLQLETFLILRRIQRDTIINVHKYSCKVPVILVRF